MLRLLRIFGVHPLVGTFQFAGGFSVALEDGPICVHFHPLCGLVENDRMNGCPLLFHEVHSDTLAPTSRAAS